MSPRDRFAPPPGPGLHLHQAGPAWFSLAHGLHDPGMHESTIRTFHVQDLSVRSASIVRMSLSCLVDLNPDLHHIWVFFESQSYPSPLNILSRPVT